MDQFLDESLKGVLEKSFEELPKAFGGISEEISNVLSGENPGKNSWREESNAHCFRVSDKNLFWLSCRTPSEPFRDFFMDFVQKFLRGYPSKTRLEIFSRNFRGFSTTISPGISFKNSFGNFLQDFQQQFLWEFN